MPAAPHDWPLTWVSERHLRVTLGRDTSLLSHSRVRAAMARLGETRLPGILDITPAYTTLLLSFDLLSLDPAVVESSVRAALAGMEFDAPLPPSRLVEIPVCYEAECAPDIAEVARLRGMDIPGVMHLHSSAEYLVHFVGFSPGFAYLGGLPESLATPRLDKPRTRVPAGSVGIAGKQTGIYPRSTPGGWRLIGRTPLNLFDALRDPPSTLAMGDRVRFTPISLATFRDLSARRS